MKLKYGIFAAVLLVLLVSYGCLGEKPKAEKISDLNISNLSNVSSELSQNLSETNISGNATEPKEKANPSCFDYCVSLPHVSCVGEWNATGSYPSCFCNFVCKANVTNASSSKSAEVTPTPTNKSVSTLLSEGIQRAKSDLSAVLASGSFSQDIFTWQKELPSDTNGSIVASPASTVRFNGAKVIDTIRASGVVTMVDKSTNLQYIYGLNIIGSQKTIIDDAKSFDMRYDYLSKNFGTCQVYSKEVLYDIEGKLATVYRFKCNDVS